MIYFDSNVFIYPLIYDETLRDVEKADQYIKQLIEGKIKGCSCTLTWDEIVYIVFKSIGLNEAINAGEYFLNFPNLKLLYVDFKVIVKAQEIIEKYRVMPRDAVHAASALEYCNGEIISNDQDFDDIEGILRKF